MSLESPARAGGRGTGGGEAAERGPAAPEGAIVVNGEPRALPAGGSLARLLQEAFGFTGEAQGVAVAVNGQVVRRAEWGSYQLAPGDRVEVVQPVAGG